MITQDLSKILIVCVYVVTAAASACTVYCAQLGGRVLHCTVAALYRGQVQALCHSEILRPSQTERGWGLDQLTRVRLLYRLYKPVLYSTKTSIITWAVRLTEANPGHTPALMWCSISWFEPNLVFLMLFMNAWMIEILNLYERLYDWLWLWVWKYLEQTISPPPPVLFECSLKAELILLHSFDAFDIDCRCAALLLQYGYEMMGNGDIVTDCVTVWHLPDIVPNWHCAHISYLCKRSKGQVSIINMEFVCHVDVSVQLGLSL